MCLWIYTQGDISWCQYLRVDLSNRLLFGKRIGYMNWNDYKELILNLVLYKVRLKRNPCGLWLALAICIPKNKGKCYLMFHFSPFSGLCCWPLCKSLISVSNTYMLGQKVKYFRNYIKLFREKEFYSLLYNSHVSRHLTPPSLPPPMISIGWKSAPYFTSCNFRVTSVLTNLDFYFGDLSTKVMFPLPRL